MALAFLVKNPVNTGIFILIEGMTISTEIILCHLHWSLKRDSHTFYRTKVMQNYIFWPEKFDSSRIGGEGSWLLCPNPKQVNVVIFLHLLFILYIYIEAFLYFLYLELHFIICFLIYTVPVSWHLIFSIFICETWYWMSFDKPLFLSYKGQLFSEIFLQ